MGLFDQPRLERIGVLSGNMREFFLFVDEKLDHDKIDKVNKLTGVAYTKDHKQYFYISSHNHIRGVEMADLIKYGTWNRRDDVTLIESTYLARKRAHARPKSRTHS